MSCKVSPPPAGRYNAILTSTVDSDGNGRRVRGRCRMLHIMYGDMDGSIYNTAVYFKNAYQDAWFEDEFARRMIKSVDRSVVVGPHLIESPVLGPISPLELSGGVKTLLLISNLPDFEVSA